MAEPPRFSLFSELKRRSVFKVAVVYVAAGYGVLQGVDLAVGPLHLPSWTMALLWVLVLAGLPIAMVLAWAFELTPEGVRRAEPLPTAVRPTRPLLALGFTLGILVALTGAYTLARWARPHAGANGSAHGNGAALDSVAGGGVKAELVAVAPLENRTGDASLAPLGPMAADWITRGLTESGVAEVADFFLKATPVTDPASLRTLAQQTGAGVVVSAATTAKGPPSCEEAPVPEEERMRAGISALLIAIGGLTLSLSPPNTPPAAKIRVILDTDANNELDDQHAIAYLLLSGDVFDVPGITVNATRYGGDVRAQAAEAERIVKLCGLYPQIPVYLGANGSFEAIKDKVDSTGFDGADAVNYIIHEAQQQASHTLVLLATGKLTNIALALKRAPSIARNVRLVWLGSNYPDPGEYNQENDEAALNYILDFNVPFEIALVRYGKPSGTDAVRVTLPDIEHNMAGAGPRIPQPVVGRHGGQFSTFGDYSIDLFHHIQLNGDPPSRALYDMAAVAIVKNPAWATRSEIPAPILEESEWRERPQNPRRIVIWENFKRDAILGNFFATMRAFVPVRPEP